MEQLTHTHTHTLYINDKGEEEKVRGREGGRYNVRVSTCTYNVLKYMHTYIVYYHYICVYAICIFA